MKKGENRLDIAKELELQETIVEVGYRYKNRWFNVERDKEDGDFVYKIRVGNNERDSYCTVKKSFESLTEVKVYIQDFLLHN